ncbi:MAG: HAD family phosphatase [Actinomycetaceae bacterium]|nr:HAD family phosphatase [Actinomycetaceae bacterium]MDY6083216.1 HAD family phosphatase [Actinomycetaceae bacterium]
MSAHISAASGLPDALLMDMDGTLIRSGQYWKQAETAIFARYGVAFSRKLALRMVGKSIGDGIAELIEHSGIDASPRVLAQEIIEAVIEVERNNPVLFQPGARELLERARQLGIRLALVTGSVHDMAQVMIDQLPEGTFSVVITGDMVEHGKPNPQPFLTAARALGVDPSRSIVFEDSPAGVEAGVAAGAHTVVVPYEVHVDPPDGVFMLQSLTQADEALLRRVMASSLE